MDEVKELETEVERKFQSFREKYLGSAGKIASWEDQIIAKMAEKEKEAEELFKKHEAELESFKKEIVGK